MMIVEGREEAVMATMMTMAERVARTPASVVDIAEKPRKKVSGKKTYLIGDLYFELSGSLIIYIPFMNYKLTCIPFESFMKKVVANAQIVLHGLRQNAVGIITFPIRDIVKSREGMFG